MSLLCRRRRRRAFKNAGDFTFLDFLMPLATDRKNRRIMTKAAFWVSVAQLVVAILALAVSIVALCCK